MEWFMLKSKLQDVWVFLIRTIIMVALIGAVAFVSMATLSIIIFGFIDLIKGV